MQVQELAVVNTAYESDGFYIHPSAVIDTEVIQAAVHGMDEVRAGRYDAGTPEHHPSLRAGIRATTPIPSLVRSRCRRSPIMPSWI